MLFLAVPTALDAAMSACARRGWSNSKPEASMNIHPSAVVEMGADLGAGVSVGVGAFIEAGAQVGADCVIGPHAVIFKHVTLGPRCRVHAQAVLGNDQIAWRQATMKHFEPRRFAVAPVR